MENMFNTIIIIQIIFGILQCFFGYKIIRIILILTGFIVGFYATYFLNVDIGPELNSYRQLIGGVIGAVLFGVLYKVGIFLIGALLGYILSILFTNDPTANGIVAVVAGILALIIEKFMIIAATSFSGAWAIIKGVDYYLTMNTSLAEWDLFDFIYIIPRPSMLVAWVILGIVGMVVQYRMFGKKEEE